MGDFVKVAKINEIQPDRARLIDFRSKQIALCPSDQSGVPMRRTLSTLTPSSALV